MWGRDILALLSFSAAQQRMAAMPPPPPQLTVEQVRAGLQEVAALLDRPEVQQVSAAADGNGRGSPDLRARSSWRV